MEILTRHGPPGTASRLRLYKGFINGVDRVLWMSFWEPKLFHMVELLDNWAINIALEVEVTLFKSETVATLQF